MKIIKSYSLFESSNISIRGLAIDTLLDLQDRGFLIDAELKSPTKISVVIKKDLFTFKSIKIEFDQLNLLLKDHGFELYSCYYHSYMYEPNTWGHLSKDRSEWNNLEYHLSDNEMDAIELEFEKIN